MKYVRVTKLQLFLQKTIFLGYGLLYSHLISELWY